MSTDKSLFGKAFAVRLRQLRGTRNCAEFARFLGIKAPVYHRYEQGRIPKSDNLSVIADKCGVPVDWLLGKPSDFVTPAAGPPIGIIARNVPERRMNLWGPEDVRTGKLESALEACVAAKDWSYVEEIARELGRRKKKEQDHES